jgi:hypothetical protein
LGGCFLRAKQLGSVSLAGLLLASAVGLIPALRAQQADPLPNAPQAQQTSPAPQTAPADPKAASPLGHESYEKRKWSGFVDPGERVPVLHARDKMAFWLHEEIEPSSPLPAFVSAGYGQLTNSDPRYGSDEAAFGERLGAALLRQASMRFFADSLFPTLDHEDPRYFRKASGGYAGRALHAAEFTFIDRNDSGHRTFNASDIAGHLAASALTPVYYPHSSRTSGVVLRTWGTSIAGAAVNNSFLEFWPDVVNKIHHRAHSWEARECRKKLLVWRGIWTHESISNPRASQPNSLRWLNNPAGSSWDTGRNP